MLWSQLLVNGTASGLVLALSCVGFVLIHAGGRFYPFSFAAVFTAGAYGFLGSQGLGLTLPLMLAGLAGALFAWGSDEGVFRGLRRNGASSVELTVASIGVSVFLQNGWSLMFGDATKMPMHEVGETLAIGEARIGQVPLWGAVIALVLVIMVGLVLRWMVFGRRIRAVRGDRDLARSLGFPVRRIEVGSLLVGGAMVGVAGALVAWDVGAVPWMGQTALLSALVAVTISGAASSLWISAATGFALGLARELSIAWIPSQWRDVVTVAALLGVMAWKSRRPDWNLSGMGNA